MIKVTSGPSMAIQWLVFWRLRRTKVKTTFLSKGNDGVLLSKKLSEKDFHFLGMLFQEYHVCFLFFSLHFHFHFLLYIWPRYIWPRAKIFCIFSYGPALGMEYEILRQMIIIYPFFSPFYQSIVREMYRELLYCTASCCTCSPTPENSGFSVKWGVILAGERKLQDLK